METKLSTGTISKPDTKLSIIFNTHIPYVLQSDSNFHEQENWIFEAITETYIPLLNILSELGEKEHKNDIILSFTPCTLKQITEGKDKYIKHLQILRDVALSEIERTSSLDEYNKYQKHPVDLSDEELLSVHNSAIFYYERIKTSLDFFETTDVVEFIKNIKNIQLWTSTPNHNFLPIYNDNTIEYFIKRGISDFEDMFNRKPDGFWLPECAYKPGIEDILLKNGIKSTALNINSIGLFTGQEKSGFYNYKDLGVYVHDFRICKFLWKAPTNTIPSDPSYREFYRDMGLDVTQEYLAKLGLEKKLNKSSQKGIWTGFKYHSITGAETRLGDKKVYDVKKAKTRIKKDAERFFELLDENRNLINDQENFTLAFDSEFFGHWWFEGNWWLEEVLKYEN